MKNVWQRVQRGVRRVGDFQARLILCVLYVFFVLPVGLLARLGGDSLQVRSLGNSAGPTDSYWQARPDLDATVRKARRQF